jgi:hypothetical protein
MVQEKGELEKRISSVLKPSEREEDMEFIKPILDEARKAVPKLPHVPPYVVEEAVSKEFSEAVREMVAWFSHWLDVDVV